MKINSKFLPIKCHYLFFFASVSPILPSLMVIAKQLGVPVLVQGVIGSVILILNVIVKPIVASLSDALPRARKAIFLLTLTLMVSSYFSINFLPPMHNNRNISLSGDIISFDSDFMPSFNISSSDLLLQPEDSKVLQLLIDHDQGSLCYLNELWDCEATCNSSYSIISSNILLEEQLGSQIRAPSSSQRLESDLQRVYILKTDKSVSAACGNGISFRCGGAFYAGEACQSLWSNQVFYIYLALFTLGYIAFNTANSASDAICLDLIGEDGDYGGQRAWGTVGWGLMGPVSGLLIDWYSGGNFGKDYTPAFLILLLFGSADILISAAKLKMPRVEKPSSSVWGVVCPILRRPSFAAFLTFVLLAGAFDGVVASYIYVLQEEMARDTWYVRHIKFIQGLTMGVQSAAEAPFMWTCGWFLQRLGSSRLLSLVFLLYAVRLLGLALVGSYGPVWATVAIEALNGPCYGLGYTAIVLHAGLMSPPGTSTTVQSVTNICYEALGYSVASLVGGVVYAATGAPGIFYAFGGGALLTFFLHLLSIHWEASRGGSVRKKEESGKTDRGPHAESLLQDRHEVIVDGKTKELSTDPQS